MEIENDCIKKYSQSSKCTKIQICFVDEFQGIHHECYANGLTPVRFITRYIKCFPEFSWPGVKQKLFAFQLLNSFFAHHRFGKNRRRHAVLKAAIMIITTYHHNACFNF